MDRSWMYGERTTQIFLDSMEGFIQVAVEHMERKGETSMCCPCRQCGNTRMLSTRGELQVHLLTKGFTGGYTRWTCHGEEPEVVPDGNEAEAAEANPESTSDDTDMENLDEDDEMENMENLGDMLHDVYDKVMEKDNAAETRRFETLVTDSTRPLYPGCAAEDTRLSFTLAMLKLKATHNWSDKSFTKTLTYLASVFPKPNELPTSTYEAKKIVCPLGLDVKRYHACPNDCIIYYKEHKDLEKCPICQTPRFKVPAVGDDDDADDDEEDGDDVDGDGEVEGKKKKNKKKKSGGPLKVVWYLPVLPRLKRLFANKKEAKLMRWHAEGRNDEDDVLRHPADACQWRTIDNIYDEFGKDPRNVRFGMSTDGINPFGNMSSRHSTWPVVIWMYNLPPWLCMKRKYIHLSMLIQGPKQPGNDLNVYQQLFKDELDQLWEPGALVYDAYKDEEFSLKALLFTTVNDYPALGNQSGQTVKGYCACVTCQEDTCSIRLQGSKKIAFPGYRRWLPKDHPWRQDKENFNGEVENRPKPMEKTGQQIYDIVKDLDVVPGKTTQQSLPGIWKRKSVFWDLPYWRHLHTRHSIDVMHVEKNVCDSLVGTLLNIPDKTKDGPKSRLDLKLMGIRPELWAQETSTKTMTRTTLPPACYTLTRVEMNSFCETVHGVKVPSGYSANLRKLVDMKNKKLIGMKSHDCHVMITQILPIAIRGLCEPGVRKTITNLCSWFNTIAQKSITPERALKLQQEIIIILCELEMYFPPSFFDIMEHLMVHIVPEILNLGPVFLHNMYPFERYNGVLKRYVRNRYRPEGSIIQGYIAEECVEFCTDYMAGQQPIGVPISRHMGRLTGKGGLGKLELTVGSRDRLADYTRAHLVVLHHLSLVDPYIKMHMDELKEKNPHRGQVWLWKEHNKHFPYWLKKYWYGKRANNEDEEIVKNLAREPVSTVVTYQSYDINGYTFYTDDQDRKSVYQNSGATIEARTSDHGKKIRYFGVIEEIWELDYNVAKIPMFRVRWVNQKDIKVEDHNFTTVVLPPATTIEDRKVKYIRPQDEPWILAKQVGQVFYITDPLNKNRHVVRKSKRSIVGVDGVVDEEDYDQFDDPESDDEIGERISKKSKIQDARPYVRRSHNEGITYTTKKKSVTRHEIVEDDDEA